jgi:hypothetical protein
MFLTTNYLSVAESARPSLIRKLFSGSLPHTPDSGIEMRNTHFKSLYQKIEGKDMPLDNSFAVLTFQYYLIYIN